MKKMVAIFVCLLLVGSVFGASAVVLGKKPEKPPEEEEKTAEGYETQITDDPRDQFSPVIFGDKIVFWDFWSHFDGFGYGDVWLYDISNPPETHIAYNSTGPEIYENKIVYNNRTVDPTNPMTTYSDIYMYDLGSDGIYNPDEDDNEGEYQITTDPAYDMAPDIYGDKIVFRRVPSGQKDEIFMYDLSVDTDNDGLPNYLEDTDLPNADGRPDPDPAEIQLTDEEDPSPSNPKIFDNIVVWEIHFRVPFGKKSARTEWDVVIYLPGPDGLLGTSDDIKYRHQIPDDQRDPSIYGDFIVWEDNRNRASYMNKNQNWDIYMYYLGGDGIPGTYDDEEYQISKDKNYQMYPDIYGNIVVWQDNRNENWDIYMYDLGPDGIPYTDDEGEGEYRIPTNGADEANQVGPRIFENRIVYTDDRNGNDDIYMFTLAQ